MPITNQAPGGSFLDKYFYDPRNQFLTHDTYHKGYSATEANYAEKNQDSTWLSLIQPLGYGGDDNKGQWARALLPYLKQGYEAYKIKNPNTWFTDYARNHAMNLDKYYWAQSAKKVGRDPYKFASALRWQPRQ